jgi:uncharacterized protein (TIGR03066 family)
MKLLRLALVACLALGFTTAVRSQEKKEDKGKYKEKIIGVWEIDKATAPEQIPPGTTVEYTKDGKMKIHAKVGEMELKLEGTYSVDGDQLKTTMKGPDGKEMSDTDTITKLTDKEMVIKDSRTKKLITFNKKK